MSLAASTPWDKILCGRCFYQCGEYRRCLAALEQESLLTIEAIRHTHDCISLDLTTTAELRKTFDYDAHVGALLLAAQCLCAVEQYDDCILLLEPFILLEDNEDLISSISSHARQLAALGGSEESNDSINTLAGDTRILLSFSQCFFTLFFW